MAIRKGAARLSEPTPRSVSLQVYSLLIAHGFAAAEAAEHATKTATAYRNTTQSVFSFSGGLKIEILAANARVISAPRNYETPRRTMERIQAQQEIDLEKRAREIGERRKRDEWRDQY